MIWIFLTFLCVIFITIFQLCYKFFSVNTNSIYKMLLSICYVFFISGFLSTFIIIYILCKKNHKKIHENIPLKQIFIASIFLIITHISYIFVYKFCNTNPAIPNAMLSFSTLLLAISSYYFFSSKLNFSIVIGVICMIIGSFFMLRNK
jgi:drug/metabolite transporter (DMT)-like permease